MIATPQAEIGEQDAKWKLAQSKKRAKGGDLSINKEFLSLAAQRLRLDRQDGCIVSAYNNGADRFVMPRPGGPIPRTRGQVSDAAAQELFRFPSM